ncbi:conserved repeat domain protein, partial [Vibrio parahaemolyticus V-223/04]|jgi:hypothetical protein
MPSL